MKNLLMTLKSRFRNSLLIAVTVIGFSTSATISVSGCAAVVQALPTVISAVTDASLVLSTIETFVNAYFASHPNVEKQKDISLAISRAKTSLDAALRIAHGAQKLDQAKVDEAFAEFKIAYAELIGIVDDIGVVSGPNVKRMMAGPGTLTVPEPLALSLKIEAK